MKKKLIIVLIIVLLILLSSFIYYAFSNPFLSISLKGKKEIVLEVNDKYKELGASIKGTNKKYKILGNVDTSKLGEYNLTYKIKVLQTEKTINRKVKIVDTTKPTITLVDGDITIYKGTEYKEPGYSATDNYDGDITNNVVIDNNIDINKVGEYKIVYKVKDSSNNSFEIERKVTVKEKVVLLSNNVKTKSNNSSNNSNQGITYIKGILLVNKKYSLPSTYNPGVNSEAYNALLNLQKEASNFGYSLPLLSGFRSYSKQTSLYNYYVSIDGEKVASTYSARPGQSEHQTGLAFDVGQIDDNYGATPSGIWLANNCHKYGFIIRYLKGKESITGYKYEPWHIRYVGVEHATKIYNANITLEEYLGVN